jgi:hypothetical protein
MGEMVVRAVEQAGTNFVQSAAELLPRAVITLSIVLVGWLMAMVARWLTRWVLGRIGFGRLVARQGVGELLKTADLPSAEALAGTIVFWIVWVGFLLSGVDALGFPALRGVLREFTLFVPRLIVALAILFVGFVFANFAWRATLLAAINARVPSPRVLSGAIRSLILILTAAMALDQIALARTIVLTAFAIAFGAVMLGLSIAFGIGGGGIARRILDHWFPERSDGGTDELRHL